MTLAATTETLALLGGPRAISAPFKRYNTIGEEELRAARGVLESGVLSQFLGAWHQDFNGGPRVREFERAWESHFGVAHAVTVNSATSGLIAALGAVGVEPGDEVIVSPWTMCASATAILVWNAIPVFADITADTFCLDPASVEANITPQTRAIVAPDIFGHSADMDALRRIAAARGLALVSDSAQAPGARYHDRFAGTLADAGVFSLNYHKHIHTGEGGVVVTDDDATAERLRLIRNHAEAVVGPKGTPNLDNMLGFNFRLGEIECAIGLEQLKKLPRCVESRQQAAERLTRSLQLLPGLRTPFVQDHCTHVFYVYPLVLDPVVLGVPRRVIHQALAAEGVTCVSQGYQNVHLLPMYQRKIAYGASGFPWTADICRRDVSYAKGICPTAETLHDELLLSVGLCTFAFDREETDALAGAFHKVWANLPALRDWARDGGPA
jgi:dTDP-4-amino-4,6-dideoxygalactose transaminase